VAAHAPEVVELVDGQIRRTVGPQESLR
jgi:hypothetical protein